MDQMSAAGLPQVTTVSETALPLAAGPWCTPAVSTPYDVTHLGHAATFVWVDTLARVLHADGTEVIVCRNVTDVDDVLLAAANRAADLAMAFKLIRSAQDRWRAVTAPHLAALVRAGARVERERRFLLAGPPPTSAVTARRRITDRYLPATRLRSRRVDYSGGGACELTFTQKVPAGRPGLRPGTDHQHLPVRGRIRPARLTAGRGPVQDAAERPAFEHRRLRSAVARPGPG